MPRILRTLAILLAFIGAAVSHAPTAPAAVIHVTNPSDYGSTIQPVRYDLGGLIDAAPRPYGDLRQGYVDDCYEVAVQVGILHQYPTYFSSIYRVQTDGTVDVTLYKSGVPYIYNVSPDINPWFCNPSTGYDSSNGDAAGAIMLKAYAAWRTPAGTMGGLAWGLPSESFAAYGLSYGFVSRSVSDIIAAFQSGQIVIIDTGSVVTDGTVPLHSYNVWSVDPVAMTITLRSPWGDGYGPTYDEFLSVGQAWLNTNYVGGFTGVPVGASPDPVPEPDVAAVAGVIGVGVMLKRRRVA